MRRDGGVEIRHYIEIGAATVSGVRTSENARGKETARFVPAGSEGDPEGGEK